MLSLIYMSLVFAVYQSAISTGLNVMTQIFEQKGYNYLGNVSIFIIFTFGMIGNFVCITYIRKMQYNLSFCIHSLGYLSFLISGLLVCHCSETEEGICNKNIIYISTIIFSGISGFASSGLFITQNDYVAQMSRYGKRAGLYYGIAWSILQTSQVIGSIYSAFVITHIKQFYFYLLMVAIACIGSAAFLLVKSPKQKPFYSVQAEEDVSEEMDDPSKMTPYAVIYTMKEFRTQCLIIPMMFTGCLLSFQWNVMHYLIENSLDLQKLTDEEINKYTLLVMVSLGIFEVIGGLIIGLVNSYIPKYSSQQLQFQLFFAALLIAIINSFELNYGYCFIVAALWGFVDCGTTSTLLAILASDFNKQIQYFGLFNFLQCVGGMLSTIAAICLQNVSIEWSIFYLLIFLCLSKFGVSCYQRMYIQK